MTTVLICKRPACSEFKQNHKQVPGFYNQRITDKYELEKNSDFEHTGNLIVPKSILYLQILFPSQIHLIVGSFFPCIFFGCVSKLVTPMIGVRWILRRASTGYCKRLSEVTGRVEGWWRVWVSDLHRFDINSWEWDFFFWYNRIAILSFSPRHEMDRLWERNTKFGPLTCDLIWGLFYRGSSEGKLLTFVGTQIQGFQLPKQNVWMEMGNLQKSAPPKQLKIRHGFVPLFDGSLNSSVYVRWSWHHIGE